MSLSSNQNRVIIFDTTMRDGDQPPGDGPVDATFKAIQRVISARANVIPLNRLLLKRERRDPAAMSA